MPAPRPGQQNPFRHHGLLFSSPCLPLAPSITTLLTTFAHETLKSISRSRSTSYGLETFFCGTSPRHTAAYGSLLTPSRPNLDSIQALLMTSFVLLNDMKAEASWALLGLTCRLAQSLGLHRAQTLDGRQSPELVKREMSRRKLWYFVFLFSISSFCSLSVR